VHRSCSFRCHRHRHFLASRTFGSRLALVNRVAQLAVVPDANRCVVVFQALYFSASRAGLPLLRTGWILWSIVAFALSGIAFAWRVAPLQKRLLAMARDEATFDWTAYRAMSLRWELWGLFATVMPGVAVVVMKPHCSFVARSAG